MRILYINPARLEAGLDAIIKGAPLSLISIAAMVPEHDANLFDFKVDKYREKKFRNELNRTDVVAITSMTPQIYHAFDVAEMALLRPAVFSKPTTGRVLKTLSSCRKLLKCRARLLFQSPFASASSTVSSISTA